MAASPSEILITTILDEDLVADHDIIDANTLVKHKIFPRLKFMGFFLKFFMFETKDNQLEFNKL